MTPEELRKLADDDRRFLLVAQQKMAGYAWRDESCAALCAAAAEIERLTGDLIIETAFKTQFMEQASDFKQRAEAAEARIATARAEVITELEVYGPPPVDMHWKAFLAYFKRHLYAVIRARAGARR